MKTLSFICICLSAILFTAAGVLGTAAFFSDVNLWYAVTCFLAAAVLLGALLGVVSIILRRVTHGKVVLIPEPKDDEFTVIR